MSGSALVPEPNASGNGQASAAAERVSFRPCSRGSVSIIIAARNNAPFLAEAIESALEQTVSCRVISVDDCSYDDSLDVARRYEGRGVSVLCGEFHQGVCDARNRGAAEARGDYLVFLDGDDVIPPDFVEKHLAAMRPDAPFVYGAARAFGELALLWDAPEWDAADLWQRNFVNTSALWDRLAFEAGGRWRDGIKTMWDWDLALRGARLGRPRRSGAVLNYRQHAGSWSAGMSEKYKERQTRLLPLVRRMNARLSVGSVVSGRVAALFPRWMSCLAQAVRLMQTAEPVELVLLDNSGDPALASVMRAETMRYATTFETVRILPYSERIRFHGEADRRDRTARFMADACNRLRGEMRGDVHWLVEDDILVPLEAGVELFHSLTSGWQPPQAVSGCYRNRHRPSRYVGGWFRDGRADELRQLPETAVGVDVCGTGCLMFWVSRTPRFWDSHLQGVPAHDWNWCARLKEPGGLLLMLPSVRCGHAVDAATVIEA
ncbi:MAG: glycosyltransferase family 2 protein [Planctomycetaceae bacterium]